MNILDNTGYQTDLFYMLGNFSRFFDIFFSGIA